MARSAAALAVTVAALASGCGTTPGAAAGPPSPARNPPRSYPPVRTLPSQRPMPTALLTPPPRPWCPRHAGSVTLATPCRIGMARGQTLTAALSWPLRITKVSGTSVQLTPAGPAHDGAQRFEITAVLPGVTDISAAFTSVPPGAAARAIEVTVTVSG